MRPLNMKRQLKVLGFVLLLGSLTVGCADQPTPVEPPSSKLTNAATRKLQLGDLKGALKDYDQAIAQNPQDADTLVNRGIAQAELGQNQAAIADYTKAIELKPDLHLAYYNRANVQVQMKAYKGAIADYTKAIELKPDNAYAYANRSSAQLKAGNSKSAIQDLQKASEIFSTKNDQKNMQRVQRLLTKLTAVPAATTQN
jgi:tetratricopeptide (TPR) repeat protein